MCEPGGQFSRRPELTALDSLFALQKVLDLRLGLGQTGSRILLPIKFDGGNLPTWRVGQSLIGICFFGQHMYLTLRG